MATLNKPVPKPEDRVFLTYEKEDPSGLTIALALKFDPKKKELIVIRQSAADTLQMTLGRLDMWMSQLATGDFNVQ